MRIFGFLFGFLSFLLVSCGGDSGVAKGQGRLEFSFDHNIHDTLGLDCSYCHGGVLQKGASAEMPDLQQCFDCHKLILRQDSAIAFWRKHPEKIPDWHGKSPPLKTARFDHFMHSQAGFSCADCHEGYGTPVRWPGRSMQDCVSCHTEHQAPLSCGTCHQ